MEWEKWVMSMLQANEGMNQAVKHFHLTSDKEIANMAAFVAMGQDPNNAPRFWAPRPSENRTVNITNMSNSSRWTINWPIIGAIVAVLVAIAVVIYAMTFTAQQQEFQKTKNQIEAAIQQVRDKIKPRETPLNPLTAQICEELDSDPTFKAEIEKDVAAIAQKIMDHRNKRLNQ